MFNAYNKVTLQEFITEYEKEILISYEKLQIVFSRKDLISSIIETPLLEEFNSLRNSINRTFPITRELFEELNSILSKYYLETEILINKSKIDTISRNSLELKKLSSILYIGIRDFEQKNPDEKETISFDELKDSIIESLTSLKKIMGQNTGVLRSIRTTLTNTFAQYQIQINENFKSALSKELEQHDKKILTENSRLNHLIQSNLISLRQEISNNKESLDSEILISKNELDNIKKGNEIIKNKNFELLQKINQYSNKVNELVGTKAEELTKKFEELMENQKSDYENKIKEINDSYETAKKNHQNFSALAERAGIYGLTQNYSKKAKEEKIEYQSYRRYTTFAILAAIATTVAIILIPIIEHWGMSITLDSNYYYTLMARLTISIMFFVLALYLSKQASKHYECYQENHRTYLQLAALEPFINRMSDEEQLKIRKALIPIYFNQNKEGKFASNEDEIKFSLLDSQLKKLNPLKRINNSQTKP